MVELKVYKLSFDQLCNVAPEHTIKSLLNYLVRTNPEEKGHGTTYKYTCPTCGQLHLSLAHYSCHIEVDLGSIDKLCSYCTSLLMALKIGDF